MEPNKQAILNAIDAFANQRPGLEFGNYGDIQAYRSESRRITRDLADYRQLRNYVGWHDSITADDLLDAARNAYAGRLSLVERDGSWAVDYCTGQYFPTEYRRAACAVMSAAIWSYKRDKCMPEPAGEIESHGYKTTAYKGSSGRLVSAGDWLRGNLRREFGRGIAAHWFN